MQTSRMIFELDQENLAALWPKKRDGVDMAAAGVSGGHATAGAADVEMNGEKEVSEGEYQKRR